MCCLKVFGALCLKDEIKDNHLKSPIIFVRRANELSVCWNLSWYFCPFCFGQSAAGRTIVPSQFFVKPPPVRDL